MKGRDLLLAGALAAPLAAGGPAEARVTIKPLNINAPVTMPADLMADSRRKLQEGDATGALADLKALLVKQPDDVRALDAAGVAYDRLGRYDLAAHYYLAALTLEPGSSVVENNFGYSLFLAGDFEAARAHLERAARGGDPDAAEAARRTLAILDRRRPVVVAVDDSALVHVERVNAHEQRLVLPTPALAAQAQVEHALAKPAPLARETRPTPATYAQAAATTHARADRSTNHDRVSVVEAKPPLVEDRLQPQWPGREGAREGLTTMAAVGSRVFDQARGPNPLFDSDDPELNAFAEKMHQRQSLDEPIPAWAR
jgi:Flp pilus assembly protein TadD